PPRPHRHDVWIAAAGLAGGLFGIVFDLNTTSPDRSLGPLALVGLLAMCGAVLLRRMPPVALPLAVAAFGLDAAFGGLLAVMIMLADIFYAATLYGGPRFGRAVTHGSTVLSITVAVGALAWLRTPEALLFGVLCAGVTSASAWTGLMLRDHREAAAAERLRAEQTALLAEMDRAQAVAGERSRMARELHDMVANHLSAIAIHSTAALTLDEPAATRQALTVIRENSTQGLTEMRRLIGLLRDSGATDDPEAVPSLDGLPTLLRRASDGGAGRLAFTARDERPEGAPLPTPIELAAYRIVQESLTNAVKHAAPGEVEVALAQDEEALTVTVTSPYDADAPSRAPGSGTGLIGMRERVELLAGAFAAGPAPDQGSAPRWRVRATLPLAGS
ncbi:two-component sensor histidine kinase, partial [Streptomyces sp. 8K308]|uniref:sensor histidine kinase n=1 Tax=Streptomyces sp. 8K308 TaxID=2530388 RepID=UPI001048EB3E